MRSLVVISACLLSCGEGPVLQNLRCSRGDRACQADQHPHTIELSVDFEDADGDLGRGLAHVLVEGDRQWTREASELFAENGVALDATSGTLELRLDLTFSSFKLGKSFDVGIEVEDAAGHLSNDPSLRFRIVSP